MSYISKERAPFKDDIDLDDLSKKEWKRYAEICGRSLAHAHSLSDDIGALNGDLEPRILASVDPRQLFLDDVVRFAAEAAERLRSDHEAFRADHALGAFRTIDHVYR